MQNRRNAVFMLATLALMIFTSLLPVWGVENQIPQVDRRFCLSYLMAPSEEKIIAELERLQEYIDSPSRISETELGQAQYAAGVLHVYRYIRSSRKDDAMAAKELLEAVEPRYRDQELFIVHSGMAHAFVASIRTIFGLGDLKKMQVELQSIPREHPDWLLRFLRGTTSIEVGRALPGVFSIKEIKEEAVKVGSADLNFVLAQKRLPDGESFRPETYDFERYLVPHAIAKKATEVLQAE